MGKRYLLVAIVFLLGMLGEGRGESPHQAARRCFDRFTADCDSSCAICHMTIGMEAPPVKSIGDYYPELDNDMRATGVPAAFGDIPLCMGCHPEKGPGIGHPVGIRYEAGLPGKDLRDLPREPKEAYGERNFTPPPQGPKLFCDESGSECWVFCTTCHDPHQGEDKLLRRPAPGASLCLHCHRK
jgi:predicted CXXCH cytochrome family protein